MLVADGQRMRSLEDIRTEIIALPVEDRASLLSWLLETDRRSWDEQIRADFSAGGAGMELLAEVDDEIRKNNFRPLE
jgi:hypothetical protein